MIALLSSCKRCGGSRSARLRKRRPICARKSNYSIRCPLRQRKNLKPLSVTCGSRAAKLLELTPDVPEQARAIVLGMESAEELTDFLAPNLNLDVPQKQALLEEKDVEKRLHAVQASISSQLEIAQIQQKLQQDVQSQFTDAQRRAYLREQVKAIQKELGEGDSGAEEQWRSCAKNLRPRSRRKR